MVKCPGGQRVLKGGIGGKMTKRELVSVMATKTGHSKKEVEKVIDTLVDIITEKVNNGEKVSVTSFGTFYLGQIASRRGRDPQTGKEISIPDMRIPRFRAGKGLKENCR
jgi:DNA-binding protein HU-beta